MSTPLVDNPAIFDPTRALTRAEQTALTAIAFFKHHRQGAKSWQVGDKRIPRDTIAKLQVKGLVKHAAKHRLDLTPIGQIAREKLEAPHGTA